MYRLVLANGTIVDGKRSAPFTGWVGIKDGKIAKISTEPIEGEKVVDCSGKIISPGFIDLHTHSDATPLNKKPARSMVNQGITLQLSGNCGISILPCNDEYREDIQEFFQRIIEIDMEDKSLKIDSMEDYIKEIGDKKLSTNMAQLIGHGTLRAAVMGFDDRDPTPEELEKMKALLAKELEAGAFGMSLGLIYPPSNYGKREELTELAKIVSEHGGILTVHMRNEGEHVFEAVDEMLEIAKDSGVHLQISHLKLMGKSQWGRGAELVDNIKAAIAAGAIVTCDQYPYQATSTGLSALVPPWAHDGGNKKMVERLAQPSEKLLADILGEMSRRGGPAAVEISSTHGHVPELDGKKMDEIAETYSLAPEAAVAKLLYCCNGEVSAIYYAMSKEDVLTIMKEDFISIGSDGYDFDYELEYNPHPRSFGTFPQFFQLVRENDLIPIETAVFKVTGLPAGIINLKDRGVLEEGAVADITVFDYSTIKDNATFTKSAVAPSGIEQVIINGVRVIADGKEQKEKAGVLLLAKH